MEKIVIGLVIASALTNFYILGELKKLSKKTIALLITSSNCCLAGACLLEIIHIIIS